MTTSQFAFQPPSEGVDAKRALLSYVRFRFSPETQPVRETAIDHYVENILYGIEDAATAADVAQFSRVALGGRSNSAELTGLDVQRSLRRLSEIKRVIVNVQTRRYSLSADVRQEINESIRRADELYDRIIAALFATRVRNPAVYKTPFFEFLAAVFSQVSDSYIRLLRNELPRRDLQRLPPFQRGLRFVQRRYAALDHAAFEAAAVEFFDSSHPDYASLKWNLAQGHYVRKCLGVDSAGALLSADVFKDASFHLDTNVAIEALTPDAVQHGTFRAVVDACKRLNISVSVAQISIDELRNVVASARRDVPRVSDKVPDALARRVRNVFFEMYREATLAGETDIDRIFAGFDAPCDRLRERYGVELIDDRWFDAADDDDAVQTLADKLRNTSPRRPRVKSHNAAVHDAKLLMWVQNQRLTGAEKTFVITTDRSLPTVRLATQSQGDPAIAITLDAVIQWLSPVALSAGDHEEVARVFSESLKCQLLPRDNFFDMQDFLAFAEMEWDTRVLPADDVEQAVRLIRSAAVRLDPTSAEDREKIARIMSKFFVDPGRKFRNQLAGLETLALNAEAEAERVTDASISQHDRIDLLETAIGDLRKELSEVRDDRDATRQDVDKARRILRRIRVTTGAAISLAMSIAVLLLADHFGLGDTLWQRLVNSMSLSGPLIILSILIGCVVAGPENLGNIKWAVTRYLSMSLLQLKI